MPSVAAIVALSSFGAKWQGAKEETLGPAASTADTIRGGSKDFLSFRGGMPNYPSIPCCTSDLEERSCCHRQLTRRRAEREKMRAHFSCTTRTRKGPGGRHGAASDLVVEAFRARRRPRRDAPSRTRSPGNLGQLLRTGVENKEGLPSVHRTGGVCLGCWPRCTKSR